VRLPILPVPTCAQCAFRAPCGGLHGQQSFGGCFHGCGTDCGGPARCDWVCPAKQDFVDHVREVGGLDAPPTAVLPLTNDLPSYVPMVRHGASRGSPLSADVVALSLGDVLGGAERDNYGAGLGSAADVRSRFKIRSDARVVLVCVADDRPLERYWALRASSAVPDKLAGIGLLAVTIPNFSVFDDAPRTHTLWNWRRMAIVAGELSAAGVAVIPHLNSSQVEDWDRWYTFLRDNPGIAYVAKEFQTGLRARSKGVPAIRSLAELQQRLGRPLHPVVVGGVAYAADLAAHFDRLTFVDSQPFMKAVYRRKRSRMGRWEAHPTDGLVDDLLEENVATHAAHVRAEIARGRIRGRFAA
jgi:hypothetical protein